MSEVVPLFKSHYSLGRSILTLEKAGETAENYPDSIIDIVKNNKFNGWVSYTNKKNNSQTKVIVDGKLKREKY